MNNKEFVDKLEHIRKGYSDYCELTDPTNLLSAPEICAIQEYISSLEHHHERVSYPGYPILQEIRELRTILQNQIHDLSITIPSVSRRNLLDRILIVSRHITSYTFI